MKKGGGTRGAVKVGVYGGTAYWTLMSELDRSRAENAARALLNQRVKVLDRTNWDGGGTVLVMLDEKIRASTVLISLG